jgi:poly(hydroxyalkanoate) depolymerase family esterase
MNDLMYRDMLEATRLTRAGQLAEATALLQRRLSGAVTLSRAIGTEISSAGAPMCAPTADGEASAQENRASRIIDATVGTAAAERPAPSPWAIEKSDITVQGWRAREAGRKASGPLPEALTSFLERFSRSDAALKPFGLARPSSLRAPEIVPDGAQFIARTYRDQAASLAYKLYIPSGYRGQALPLIVMLHGCTQSPDDFAAGTRMNELAEEHTCFVVYPAQSSSANFSKCWNWFSPRDQQRGQGEPALIAGVTRQIMCDYAVDARRVYVAGLSAGAAAAAIMGMNYPDLYAAIGVHSGLACGAASDLPSAFAAMRQGRSVPARGTGIVSHADPRGRVVPTIVFHGDRDTTVNPCNGDHVIEQSKAAATLDLRTSVEHGQMPGGRAYSRTLHVDAGGRAILEHWIVRGAGHAWSGGSPAGSYTDPRGPDASREMLRFFLEHAQ